MYRTGRSIGNFITGFALQAITLGIGLLTTPLLLHWLGDERYGAFRAASDWTGYVNLLELGISGSLLALLAKAIGQGDREQIRLTLVTGVRVYLRVVVGMLLVGVALGWLITDLVQVSRSLESELQRGYWLGLLSILLLPLTPFRLFVDASQRSYFTNAFLIFQSLVSTSLALLVARAGLGIPGQYLAVLLGGISFQLLMCWNGLRCYPDIFAPIGDRQAYVNIEQQVWTLNWSTFFLNISGQIGLLTDNIIISYNLGSVMVVPFFVTQRLAVLAQVQMQGIGNATWAALADLYAKGERQTFNTRLIELTQLVAVLGLAFMSAIAAYNPYFIGLWVGQTRFGSEGVSFLAASNGFLAGLLSLWGWCFIGTGNIAKVLLPAVISSTTNLVVSVIGTHLFGLIGPLLGTFVAFITISLWWLPMQLQQVFGTSLQQLFWAVAKPLGFGIPYAVIAWWFARSHTPWGWFGLAAEMGLTALLYIAIAWCLVFSATERSKWISRLPMLLPKAKSNKH